MRHPDDLARIVDELQAQHVVDHRTVRERVRTTRVGGDVAAERRRFLARGIGSEEELERLGSLGELEIHDAGLCLRAAVRHVELEHAIHACERDDHAAGNRDGAAAQPRPRAAGDDRLAAVARDAHDGADVACIARQHRNGGQTVFAEGIKRVDGEVFGFPQDGIRAQCVDEAFDQRRERRRCDFQSLASIADSARAAR